MDLSLSLFSWRFTTAIIGNSFNFYFPLTRFLVLIPLLIWWNQEDLSIVSLEGIYRISIEISIHGIFLSIYSWEIFSQNTWKHLAHTAELHWDRQSHFSQLHWEHIPRICMILLEQTNLHHFPTPSSPLTQLKKKKSLSFSKTYFAFHSSKSSIPVPFGCSVTK